MPVGMVDLVTVAILEVGCFQRMQTCARAWDTAELRRDHGQTPVRNAAHKDRKHTWD